MSDDPLAAVDVPHMCHQEGHDVIAIERVGDGLRLVLRARGKPSVGAE